MTPRPLVVGILNCTPDSFFDGGRYTAFDAQLAAAHQMIQDGADVLDVGGESTRPGAAPVDAEEECRRVLPVLAALRDDVPLSIDTTKPIVAERAAEAGATWLNDVNGLTDPRLADVSAAFEATVVMHTRGTPRTMGQHTQYDSVVDDVCAFLAAAAARARSPHVYIDPGIGFAKTAAQSLTLLQATPRLVALGWPVYIGASRKSFIGQTLSLPDPNDRLVGSLAAVAAAYAGGATVFRVHDVRETRQLLDMLHAIALSAHHLPT